MKEKVTFKNIIAENTLEYKFHTNFPTDIILRENYFTQIKVKGSENTLIL